jgi:sporulation-control protein
MLDQLSPAHATTNSPSIDTRLLNLPLTPGAMMNGEVHISGGEEPYTIGALALYVTTNYLRTTPDHMADETCVLFGQRLIGPFVIQPRRSTILPFTLKLPYHTPLTLGYQAVYLHTSVDTASAFDAHDVDRIDVQPHPSMRRTLDAFATCGFTLESARCVYHRYLGQPFPFVQTFSLLSRGQYRGALVELEAVLRLGPNALDVLIETNRHNRSRRSLWRSVRSASDCAARLRVPHNERERDDLVNRLDRALQYCLE